MWNLRDFDVVGVVRGSPTCGVRDVRGWRICTWSKLIIQGDVLSAWTWSGGRSDPCESQDKRHVVSPGDVKRGFVFFGGGGGSSSLEKQWLYEEASDVNFPYTSTAHGLASASHHPCDHRCSTILRSRNLSRELSHSDRKGFSPQTLQKWFQFNHTTSSGRKQFLHSVRILSD